jgi:hypothetical protein
MQSNFSYIRSHKPGTRSYEQRLAYLEEQVKALREYHKRARARKKYTIARLILNYEQALYTKGD